MKKTSLVVVVVLFFLLSVSCAVLGRHAHESLVDAINSDPTAGWKAATNGDFFGARFGGDDGRLRRLFGLLPGWEHDSRKLPEISGEERGVSATAPIPEAFDAREAWPGCVGGIRDQGECGSCWAFGGVEALSDRFCVASNATVVVALAPLDPVTCDDNDAGCQGGDLSSLWEYAKSSGIVEESCAPYNASIPTCPPAQEPCLNFVNTPKCKKTCADGSEWSASKRHARSVYSVGSAGDVAAIQREIMTNGPVEAGFTVYEDFLAYKSGVYKHVKGNAVGGHAVKIIGWGVDNSTATPYWTIANSWTTTWGDQGYFLMLRGKDECGIEDGVVAGLPLIQ